jgi:hypothetical protein
MRFKFQKQEVAEKFCGDLCDFDVAVTLESGGEVDVLGLGVHPSYVLEIRQMVASAGGVEL